MGGTEQAKSLVELLTWMKANKCPVKGMLLELSTETAIEEFFAGVSLD